MRGLGHAIGAACFLISTAVHAEDVRLGNSSVKVSPPRGFCEPDKTDTALLNGLSDYVKAGGFVVIASYLDCRELEEWRRSGTFIRTKIAFLKFSQRADRPPSQYISEACDKSKEGVSRETRARISEAVTKFTNGSSSVQNMLSLGVLDEERGTVCYAGSLIKGKVANTGEVTLVYLSAATIVDDQPVSIVQWTNFLDDTSIAKALASLKDIHSNFAASIAKSN